MPTFIVFDVSAPPLINSPSPLQLGAWAQLLEGYPGDLGKLVVGILRYRAHLEHSGIPTLRIAPNHLTVALDPAGVTRQVDSDLSLGRIAVADPVFPFISSPLGLVPKLNGTFRRIHDLSYPKRSTHSTNAGIAPGSSAITYVQFDDITNMILRAGKGCYLFKKDVKDAFRIIPIAPADR
jgi:hypothetical protein